MGWRQIFKTTFVSGFVDVADSAMLQCFCTSQKLAVILVLAW